MICPPLADWCDTQMRWLPDRYQTEELWRWHDDVIDPHTPVALFLSLLLWPSAERDLVCEAARGADLATIAV